jgi:hypothetical protein
MEFGRINDFKTFHAASVSHSEAPDILNTETKCAELLQLLAKTCIVIASTPGKSDCRTSRVLSSALFRRVKVPLALG